MGVCRGGEPEGDTTRVETLLATVREMSSYLLAVSRQLEREIGEALDHQRGPGSAMPDVEALRAENAQLHEALQGRAPIEQAKGMLMAIHGCDEDTAFRLLVAVSRQERRKLRLVASEVVNRCADGTRPVRPATVEGRAGEDLHADPSGSGASRPTDRDDRRRTARG